MANQEVKVFFKVDGLDGYINDLGDLQKALGQAEDATKELADTQGDLETNVNNLESKLEALEGGVKLLAGSAEVAAGALGLLGVENEFFKKVEENVINIIALAEGAINMAEGYKLLRQNLQLAAVAQNGFNKAAFKNPYVILAVTLVAAAGAIYALVRANQDSTTAVEDNTDALNEQNKELDKQIEREEYLAELRGEDIFKVRLNKAKQNVSDLEAEQARLQASIEELADTFVELPYDINDPSKGTYRVYSADADSTELDAVNERLKKAQDDLRKLEEEADAREKGRNKEQQEERDRDEKVRRDNLIAQREAAEDELYLLSLTAQDREETLAMQAFDARIALGVDEVAAEEQLQRDLQEIRDRYAAEDKAKRDAEDKERQDQVDTVNAALIAAEQGLQDAKFNAASAGFQLLSSLAGENEKLQNVLFLAEKAAAIARVFIDAARAKQANLVASAQIAASPIPGAVAAAATYLAASNQAVNLGTATNIATIAATTIAKFKGGGAASPPPDPSFNPGSSINYSFGQQAGETIQPGQLSTGQQTPPPTQTYVLASDVTSAQEAQAQIENLSRL